MEIGDFSFKMIDDMFNFFKEGVIDILLKLLIIYLLLFLFLKNLKKLSTIIYKMSKKFFS